MSRIGKKPISVPKGVKLDLKPSHIKVTGPKGSLERDILINNMVEGVCDGFKKKLVVEGVGYKVSVAGNVLTLNVGYSNPVDYKLPAGVKAAVEKNDIILESIDKELLGQTAAKIRQIRKPEPYKGKGIRYDGEYIARKVGKAAGKK
ncbi:MAG: 50S ribosomal protein L6 [Deltaproteobacteria bacterium]